MKKIYIILFMLGCGIISYSQPVSILEEDFNNGIPDEWTQQTSSSGKLWTCQTTNLNYPSGTYSGTGRLVTPDRAGKSISIKLISPTIDLSGVFRPRLSFAHAQCVRTVSNNGYFDTLRIYYRISANDTWHPLVSYNTNLPTWVNDTIDLVNTNTSTYQIAFEAVTSPYGRGVALDLVKVFPTVQCDNIAGFGIETFSTKANISINAGLTASNFQIILSDTKISNMDNYDTNNAVFYRNNQNSFIYTIPNLTPNTKYYLYARYECLGTLTGYSNWKDTTFVTTYGYPFTFVFDAISKFNEWQNATGNLADAFKGTQPVNNTTTDNIWVFATKSAKSTYSLFASPRIYSKLKNNGMPIWFISPKIDLTAVNVDNISLTMDVILSMSYDIPYEIYSRQNCKFHITVSDDGGETWRANNTVTWSEYNDADYSLYCFSGQCRKIKIDLSQYKGNHIKFALVVEGSTNNYFHINNIAISNSNTTCSPVHDFATESISDKAVNLVWNKPNNSTPYLIQISDTVTFNSTTGNYISSKNETDNSTYSFDNLQPAKRYFARIAQNCSDSIWNTVSFVTSHKLPYNNPFTSLSSLPATWQRFKDIDVNDVNEGKIKLTSDKTSSNAWNTLLLDGEFNNMAGVALYATTEGTKHDWIVSPNIFLETTLPTEGIRLSFQQSYSASRNLPATPNTIDAETSFAILVSEDNGITWTQLNEATWSTLDQTNNLNLISPDPHTVHLDLTAFNGKSIKIALYIASNQTTKTNYMFISDFKLTTYDIQCGGIENIKQRIGSYDYIISWEHFGKNQVNVKLASDNNFTTIVQEKTVTNDTAIFDNLLPNTIYYIRLQQNECATYYDLEFKTYCQPKNEGYYVDFESETDNILPQCWFALKKRLTQDFPYVHNNPEYAHTGNKMLHFGGITSNNQRTFLSLPPVEDIENYELKFWIRGLSDNQQCNDKVLVGVMADPQDTSTFILLEQIQPTNLYQEHIIDLSYSFGHGNFVTFVRVPTKCQSSYFYSFYLDDISIDPLPICHRMGKISISSITSNGAKFSFSNSNASQFQILITSASLDPDIALSNNDPRIVYNQLTPSNSLSFQLNDPALHGSTTYYAHIRGYCGDNNYGQWGEEKVFTTLCDPYTIEQFGTETFDKEVDAECWTYGFTSIGNTDQATTSAVKYFRQYGSFLYLAKEKENTAIERYNDGAYAVTRELNVDNINNYQVSFKAASINNTDELNIKRLHVGIVTNPSDMDTYELLQTIDLEYADSTQQENQYVVSFKNYEGDYKGNYGKFVAFNAEAGSHNTNYVLIDDVSFEITNGCQQPVNIYIDSVQYHTAEIHWTNTDAGQYEIWVSQQNKRPASSQTPVFTTTTTQPKATISNLMPTSKYYVFVRSVCNGDFSAWSNAKMIKTKKGVPYLETFDEYAIGNIKYTDWNGFTQVEQEADDRINIGYYEPNTNDERGWTIVEKPSFIKNMNKKVLRAEIYGNTPNALLVSPFIRMNAENSDDIFILSFKGAITSYSTTNPKTVVPNDQSLTLLVSQDGINFDPIAKWTSNGTSNYDFATFTENSLKQTINLTPFAEKTIQLAFYTTGLSRSPDMYFYLDSIEIISIDKQCAGIMNLSANSKGKQTTLQWELLGPPQSVIAEIYDDANYLHKVFETVVNNTNECIINTLAQNSRYYARCKQNNCNNAKWSYLTFSTNKKLPYEETFSTSTLNREWTKYEGDLNAVLGGEQLTANLSTGYYGWEIATTDIGLSANHLVSYFYPSTPSTDYGHKWLVSPDIDLTDNENEQIYLSFNLALTTTEQTQPSQTEGLEFCLLVSTNQGQTWLPANSWLWSDDTNKPNFYKPMDSIPADGREHVEQIDFSSFAGKIIRFAFYENNNASNSDARLHIANVKLFKQVPLCETPYDLNLVERGLNTSILNWEGDPNKTSVVEYAVDEHFTKELQRCTVQNTLTATVTNLMPNTMYYARVKQLCENNYETFYSPTFSFKSSLGLPFIESFAEKYQLPDEWETWTGKMQDIQNGGTHKPANPFYSESWGMLNSSYGISGLHLASDVFNKNDAKWCVSPVIDLSVSQNLIIQLGFYVAMTARTSYVAPNTYEKQDFIVAVSEDEGKTWKAENTWIWRDNDNETFANLSDIPTTPLYYTLDFSKYAGKRIRFAFYVEVNKDEDDNLSIDNRIHISEVSLKGMVAGCVTPYNIIAQPNLTSASLSWTANTNNISTILLADNENFNDAREIIVNNGLTTTINNLIPSTKYFVKIKQQCSADMQTEFSALITFRTLFGLPFSETFNNADIPSEWTIKKGNVDSIFNNADFEIPNTAVWRITDGPEFNRKHLSTYLYYDNAQQWIISPQIDLSTTSAEDLIQFAFDVAYTTAGTSQAPKYYATDGDELRVLVSENNGITWTPSNQYIWKDNDEKADANISAIPPTGKKIKLDFSKYVGKKICIAFYQNATSTQSNNIHIANVTLNQLDPLCSQPTEVTVTPMLQGAFVQWKGNNSLSYVLQYTADSSFNKQVEERRVSGQCNITLTNLVNDRTYYVRIKQICPSGNETEFSNVLSFKTAVAFPFEETFNKNEIPTNWDLCFGTPINAFKNNLPKYENRNPWTISSNSIGLPANHVKFEISPNNSNHWLVSPNIDLTQVDPTKTIALSFDLAYTRYNSPEPPHTSSNQSFYVLVSTDGGNSWSKNNSWLWTHSDTTAKHIYPLQTIPTTGKTLMINFSQYIGQAVKIAFIPVARVLINDIHLANIKLDYIDASCLTPNMSKIICSMTTCSLAWENWNNQNKWIEISSNNTFDTYTTTDLLSSDNHLITNLLPGSIYYLRFKQNCDEDPTTRYSDIFQITTLGSSQTVPQNLKISNILTHNATLTWDQTQTNKFKIQLVDENENVTETEFTTTDFAYQLSNLLPNTNYKVAIAACYEEVVYSDWTPQISFTTACLITPPLFYNFDNTEDIYTQDNYTMQNCLKTNTLASIHLQTNTNSTICAFSNQTALYFTQAPNNPTWLALPELNIDENTIDQWQLSFKIRPAVEKEEKITASYTTNQYAHKIKIGLVHDIYHLDSFYLLKEYNISEILPNAPLSTDVEKNKFWETVYVNLTNGHGKQIVLLSDYSLSNIFYLDDIQVQEKENCQTTDTISIQVGVTKATVMWTDNITHTYHLCLVNGKDTIQSFNNVTGSSLTLENLTQNTKYTLFLRAICDGVLSYNQKIHFTTHRGLPFVEDFNNDNLISLWKQYEGKIKKVFNNEIDLKDVTYKWVQCNNTDITGSKHAKLNIYGTSTYFWLVSPLIDLSEQQETGIRLSFDLALTASRRGSDDIGKNEPNTAQNDDKFAVLVSVDSGKTWKQENAFIWTSDGQNERNYLTLNQNYKRIKLDLSNFAGKTIQIAFYGESTISNADNDLHIDNIKINQYDRQCPGVNNLNISSISTNSATVQFEYPANTNNTAIVVLSKENNLLPENIIRRETLYNTNSWICNNIQHSTTYHVFVTQYCGSEDNIEWEHAYFKTKYGIPYNETFSSAISAEWTKRKGWLNDILQGQQLASHSSYTGWQYTSFDNIIGKPHPYLEIVDTATNYWLISPPIFLTDNGIDGVQLTFNASLSSSLSQPKEPAFAYGDTKETDDRITVALSTDSGKSWNVLYDAPSNLPTYIEDRYQNLNTDIQQIEVDLTTFVNKNVLIAFYGESSQKNVDNFFHISDVQINYFDQNCQGVKNIKTQEIEIKDTKIEFEYKGPGKKDVQIVLFHNQVDTVLIDTAYNTNYYTLPLLQYKENYTVSIRQLCKENGLSKKKDFSFITPHGIRYEPKYTDTEDPQEWEIYRGHVDSVYKDIENLEKSSMANSSWTLVDADTVIHSMHFRGEFYKSFTKNWLISPTIDLTQNIGQGIILQFDAFLIPLSSQQAIEQRYLGKDDRFILLVSKDNGKSWSPNDATVWDNKQTGQYTLNNLLDSSTTYYINMTDYAGSKIKIAFYLESTEENTDNYLHISNINIDTTQTKTYNVHICQGGDYIENGFTIYASDMVPGLNIFNRFVPQNQQYPRGMLEVLKLNVESLLVTTFYDTVCLNSHYNKYELDTIITPYTESPLVRFLTSANGCDSLVQLILNIKRPVIKNISIDRCFSAPFNWKGKNYYTSTVLIDTTTSVTCGCDSVTRIFLNMKNQLETTVYDTICFADSIIINDSVIKESGTYKELSHSQQKCDSIITHNVYKLPNFITHSNVAICTGSIYSDNVFQQLSQPGYYQKKEISRTGCDSIVSLKLLVGNGLNQFYDTISPKELPYLLNGMALLPGDAKAGQYQRNMYIQNCGTVDIYINLIDTTSTQINNIPHKKLYIAPNIVSINENIYIRNNFTEKQLKNLQITIFNTAGMVIFNQKGGTNPLFVKGIQSAGLYFVRVMVDTDYFIGTVIVK